jgi:hypothetical protein
MAVTRPVGRLAGVVSLIVLLLMFNGHFDRHNPWNALALMALFGAAIGGQAWSQWRLKCPRCGHSLAKIAILFSRKKDEPACCPYCGVNFDEPMPQNPISQGS